MKYGYARVSTEDQNPALQLAALKKAGCKTETIFKDEGPSGGIQCNHRPARHRALSVRRNPAKLLFLMGFVRQWSAVSYSPIK